MASQTIFLHGHPCFAPFSISNLSLPSPPKHVLLNISKPRALSLRRPQLHRLSLSHPDLTSFRSRDFKVSASSSTVVASAKIESCERGSPSEALLKGSTRTITTVLALAVAISKLFARKISTFALGLCRNPGPNELMAIESLKEKLVCTMGPMFFAAMSDRPTGYLNTPLTVIAAGMAKWLDIYSGVLLVRVLLSWFPNIPWDRQPLSAIRDLCDPYLNLFRNIIPPLFDTLDVSPLMAFGVLGVLGSILKSSSRGY